MTVAEVADLDLPLTGPKLAEYRLVRDELADRLRSIAPDLREVQLGRGQRSTSYLLGDSILVIPRIQLRAKALGGGGTCYWVAFDQRVVTAARARGAALAAVVACGDAEHVVVLTPADVELVLAGPPRPRIGSQGALWDPLIERRQSAAGEVWQLRYWSARRERVTLSLAGRLNAFALLSPSAAVHSVRDPLQEQRDRLSRRIEALEEAVASARAQRSGDDSDRAYNLAAVEEHAAALVQLQVLDAQISSSQRGRVSNRALGAGDALVASGSTVMIRSDDGQLERFTVVDPGSLLPGAGWVSTASPLGRAILGRRAGEVVSVDAPGGAWQVEVVSVTASVAFPQRVRAV